MTTDTVLEATASTPAMPAARPVDAQVVAAAKATILTAAGAALNPAQPATTTVQAETVDLLADCVRVSLGGAEKFISYQAFYGILKARVSREDSTESGLKGFSLPRNCTWIGKDSENLEVNFYYPECVREITYHDTKMKVVMPNLIIYHKLRKFSASEYEIVLTRYFCTDLSGRFIPKDKISCVDSRARIFLSPFSNTYEQGHMCYGYNTLPKRVSETNLRPLDGFYEFLFNSPFNDDLGIRALARSTDVGTWYRSLEKLANEGKPFPYSKLRGWISQSGQEDTSTDDEDEDDSGIAAEPDQATDTLPF